MAHEITITEQLKYLTDGQLRRYLEELKLDENPQSAKRDLIEKITSELDERVSHEALSELTQMHSNDVVDYIKALRAQKPMDGVQRIQYRVANELLLERHADLATRADLATADNPIHNWDSVFFALITDIDNH